MKIREAIERGAYWSGLIDLYARITRADGAIILMYHSVAPASEAEGIDPRNHVLAEVFERQMEFLAAHRRVIALRELVDTMVKGVTPPGGTVVVTFDDGYLDNLTVAAPILDRLKLPATLFLPTGHIERRETHWADELHGYLQSRTADALSLPGIGNFNLADRGASGASYRSVHKALLEATYVRRRAMLDSMRAQLKPRAGTPRLTMGWDEVRSLVARYPLFDLGVHTRDHIDLRTHRGDTARQEIHRCMTDFADAMGRPAELFSFPYGRWCAQTRSMLEPAAIRGAVGSGGRLRISAGNDRFVMARVAVTAAMTEFRVRSGAGYPGLLGRLGLVKA